MIGFGIFLVALQVLGTISSFIAGKNPFAFGFLETIGYFLCGIIGVILIIIGYKRKNANTQNKTEKDNNTQPENEFHGNTAIKEIIVNQNDINKGEPNKMKQGPLKIEFERWLIVRGYKVKTPSGNPSTVPQYINAIEKVMCWELLSTWEQVAQNINVYIRDYDAYGSKSEFGAIGHNTVISALRRFKEFLYE